MQIDKLANAFGSRVLQGVFSIPKATPATDYEYCFDFACSPFDCGQYWVFWCGDFTCGTYVCWEEHSCGAGFDCGSRYCYIGSC